MRFFGRKSKKEVQSSSLKVTCEEAERAARATAVVLQLAKEMSHSPTSSPKRGEQSKHESSPVAAKGSAIDLNAALQAVIERRDEPRFTVGSSTLGSGAYGEVRDGAARTLAGRTLDVAVKLIPENRMRLEALAREAGVMERLSQSEHPAMLRFYGWLTPGSRDVRAAAADSERGAELAAKLPTSHCLVMERVQGGELFDYIVERRGLPEREASAFFAQVGEAVGVAHRLGIAHRDLKLENVLFARSVGAGQRVLKLIDWGLAHQHAVGPDGRIVREELHSRCGSRSYMAPEVITSSGSRRRDGRPREPGFDAFAADVWSLGICLFAMLFGFFPFECADASKDWRAERARDAEREGGSVAATIMGFYPKKNLSLSTPARELLDRLLCFDPARRATLHEALASPWLATHVARLARAPAVRADAVETTLALPEEGVPLPTGAEEGEEGGADAAPRRTSEWAPRPSVALRPQIERQPSPADDADDTASISSVGSSVKRSVMRLHEHLAPPERLPEEEPSEPPAAAPLPPHRPYRELRA